MVSVTKSTYSKNINLGRVFEYKNFKSLLHVSADKQLYRLSG